MVFYRRNSFSDKVIAFIAFMLAVILSYTSYINYSISKQFFVADLIGIIVCLGVGVLFVGSQRFKYIEITEHEVAWYTWFVVKHTLTKDEIKEVATRKNHIILVKEKGEVWISNTYIRRGEDEVLRSLLKKLNKEVK